MSLDIEIPIDDLPPARCLKGVTDQWGFDLKLWRTPNLAGFTDDERAEYVRRKNGIVLYFAGADARIIRQASGLGIRQINRLIHERCMLPHSDGAIQGWRGLVKHKRFKEYERINKVQPDAFGDGCAGAMGLLIVNEPEFIEKLDKKILEQEQPGKLQQIRKPRHALWIWFLDQLRKLGYEVRNEWPFNVESRGAKALADYTDKILAEHPYSAAGVVGGPDLQRKMITGDGADRPHLNAFDRVEMDAHKLDGRFCIMLPTQQGGWVVKIVRRLWVIVILEVVTRAVLSVYLAMAKQINETHVRAAIKIALTKWVPRPIEEGRLHEYLEGAAMPSGHSDDYIGLCWNETSVDGELAEQAEMVRKVLKDVVGSKLRTPDQGYSSRRGKDDRPFIETFFRTLGNRGLHRLSNSTGGNPGQIKGRKPEEVAIESQFSLPHLEDLLDSLTADYNATPHSSLSYRTPLQMLDYLYKNDKFQPRKANEEHVEWLSSYSQIRTVKGGYKTGRQPYINFSNGRYTAGNLPQLQHFVGKRVRITNHIENDARIATVHALDGEKIGVVRVAPPWNKLPHSLKVRSAVSSLVELRDFAISQGGDAIEAFMRNVEANGGKLPIHPAYIEMQRILASFGYSSEAGADSGSVTPSPSEEAQRNNLDEPESRRLAPATHKMAKGR